MSTRKVDHLLGATLCALYVAVLLLTASDIGMSRDEGIYVDAAQAYGKWLQALVESPSVALQRESIDRHFVANHEHPPLIKLMFALGHLVQQRFHVFSVDSHAFRFAGMLSGGVLLWLVLVMGTRLYSRRVGLFAALAMACLPRVFYHAHLNAFDVPITLANTALAYAYLRSLTSKRAVVTTGALMGMALLTKHNSWVMPGIFALHYGFTLRVERRARRAGAPPVVSMFPSWLPAVLVLGPALFLLGWPWMWNDTLHRLNAYAAFHLHHDYYNIEYFGVNYFWPPFPMSYPWVLTLFTVPLTTLALAVTGLAVEVRAWLKSLAGLWRRGDTRELDRTQAMVLMLGCMFAPWVIIALPSTPIFGGTKHWFPAYPFMALFAGRAFDLTWPSLARLWPQRWTVLRAHTLWPVGALLLAPAVVETAHSHPFGLSHYTVAAGGVPGAADLGMNRQFWGFTTRSLAPYLRQALPRGGRVYLCDTIYSAFQMLVRDGHIPGNIRAHGDIATADLALVHHELHFGEVDQQIWTTYGSTQPAYVLRYDGVPIISVYRNPKR